MSDKLKHAPGPVFAVGYGPRWWGNSPAKHADNTRVLVERAHTAPHHCIDLYCPGNINRRKLDLFPSIVKALAELVSAHDADAPSGYFTEPRRWLHARAALLLVDAITERRES